MIYRLTCNMAAPVPREQAFTVFEDPYNLARITPPWLNFRIVSPEHVTMRQGAEIDYLIAWFGLNIKWRTVITRYDPPREFIDEQIRGPYTLWHHEHRFVAITLPDGRVGTQISDQVDYKLPLGRLGQIAHAMTVKKQLLGIFRFRQRAIAELLDVPDIAFDDPQVNAIP